ncbi:hypothetical protein [Pectobacterium carotovorum]|uniref:5'-methylthioadenosine/S-adenosylhomocysteine nucleosidase family protein n=1 Tax=Pectobacterium carotovorum TaxID=554 RepID=UPI003018077E
MKILIIDDHPIRYKDLVNELYELGVVHEDIFFVTSANEAYDHLEKYFFDLLILDILIPLNIFDDPDHSNSLNILYSISENEHVKKPGKVIGISSDMSAVENVSGEFSEHTWSIIKYSDNDLEWVRKITNCVKYLIEKMKGNNEGIKKNKPVDLVIICALETPELDAVLKTPWNWGAPRPIDDLIFVRDGWFICENKKFTVSVAFASRMGMIATALKSFAVISLLKPKAIGMTGICAGAKGKVSIGDVLFADPAWDYQSGKRVKDKGNTSFSISPHQLPASYKIRCHVEQLRSDTEFLKDMSSAFSGKRKFKTNIILGPVASGSAVLADGDTIQEIKNQQRDLIGVEMEIYGLYSAAHNSVTQPEFFALKGVCDYADPDKIDDAQNYAAYASSKIMQKLFETYGTRILE